MNQLCFTDDDFVRLRPRWVATLSDGTTVYQDDEREGVSAWDRLKAHCQGLDLHIVEFRLQFRSNVVPVDLSPGSYLYFSNSAFGFWGDTQTFHGYWVGPWSLGHAHVTHFKSPELIPLESQILEIPENSRHLILTKPEIRTILN